MFNGGQGLVVTNAHVVKGADRVKVKASYTNPNQTKKLTDTQISVQDLSVHFSGFSRV